MQTISALLLTWGVLGNKAMEACFWPQTCSVSLMEKE